MPAINDIPFQVAFSGSTIFDQKNFTYNYYASLKLEM